ELGVTAADPAAGEHDERAGEHQDGSTEVRAEGRHWHAGQAGENEEPGQENEGNTVGDGHGQEVARRRERHHGRKQQQPGCNDRQPPTAPNSREPPFCRGTRPHVPDISIVLLCRPSRLPGDRSTRPIAYCRLSLTCWKVALRLVPTPRTTTM